MKNTSAQSSIFMNIVSYLLILAVTACAFYASYFLNLSSPVKAMVWIGWLVATLLLALLTSKGKQAFNFAKNAKIELQKVVWPTKQETVQTTSVVMIMVAITGFVLWGVDSVMMWAIGKITHLG